MLLGVLALLVTLFWPKGLWGLISGNGRFQLFPTGYKLVNVPRADDQAGRGGVRRLIVTGRTPAPSDRSA